MSGGIFMAFYSLSAICNKLCAQPIISRGAAAVRGMWNVRNSSSSCLRTGPWNCCSHFCSFTFVNSLFNSHFWWPHYHPSVSLTNHYSTAVYGFAGKGRGRNQSWGLRGKQSLLHSEFCAIRNLFIFLSFLFYFFFYFKQMRKKFNSFSEWFIPCGFFLLGNEAVILRLSV